MTTPDQSAAEAKAREIADKFAEHEANTPWFASTRPFFEKIVAAALREAHKAAAEEMRERAAVQAEGFSRTVTLGGHSVTFMGGEIAASIRTLPTEPETKP